MMGHSTSNESLISQFKEYKALIDAKNEGLDALSQSNKSLLLALKNDLTDSINVILKRRSKQCENMHTLCRRLDDDGSVLKLARDIASSDGGDLGCLARDLLAEKEKTDLAAEKILSDQMACISLMKSRLEATSVALKRSVQKRKLIAAYGPTSGQSTPTFLDKQR
ncbi:hypothetical protein LLG46_07400 [bacterium]|nr:hypothetical protein [bacterium]